jgi:RNA polymerase sigma factor (sigma-70 family)
MPVVVAQVRSDTVATMSEGTDEEAYAALYARMYGRLARELRPMAGADGEDLAQEALLVARQRWDVVRTLDRPEAWVRRVALRMGTRKARRERDRVVLEAATDPPRESPAPDLDLVAALLDLSDRHSAAIRLHHLEDRPIAEVAERLGCTEGAAKTLLFRARRVLAERLAGLTGRWVSERTWTVDGVARYLAAAGWASHIDPVIEQDMGGRGGRFELTVTDGAYQLLRDDGLRFDHGLCRVDGSVFEMAPTLNVGRARYRVKVEGAGLSLHLVDTTTPPTLGVPDAVWARMLFDVAPFGRSDPSRPPM